MQLPPSIRRFFANPQNRSVALFGAVLWMMGCLTLVLLLVWLRAYTRTPLAPPMNLPKATAPAAADVLATPQATASGGDSQQPDPAPVPTDLPGEGDAQPDRKPICGDNASLTFLLVGIDYRGGNYLYGLADVIRVVRVDFTNPRVNVVSLPRALLVDLDENWFRTEGPALLNQAYFFGTPGMGKYLGEGDGAGALGQTLQYNFGVTPDHYLVMNFDAFVGFIDAIGGIDVDLPEELKTPDDEVLFPAGKQWLDGEQALQLARIRKKYSDLVRINHQTLILLSVFRRLQDPAVLANLPAVIETLRGAVVTDVTPQQVSNALCVLVQLEESDLHFSAPPGELIRDGEEYIPSLRREMQIFTWDEAFTRWMQEALADGMP